MWWSLLRPDGPTHDLGRHSNTGARRGGNSIRSRHTAASLCAIEHRSGKATAPGRFHVILCRSRGAAQSRIAPFADWGESDSRKGLRRIRPADGVRLHAGRECTSRSFGRRAIFFSGTRPVSMGQVETVFRGTWRDVPKGILCGFRQQIRLLGEPGTRSARRSRLVDQRQ